MSLWPCTDELPDALISRRVAAVVVKTIRPTPVTPDKLTILSMLFGVAAAVALAVGQPVAAALGIVISVMLDCADGQLARARGSGSPLGRVIDGLADYVVCAALHAGLLIHALSKFDAFEAAALVALAGVGLAYRAAVHDAYKSAYLGREMGPLPPYFAGVYRFFSKGQAGVVGKAGKPTAGMMRALGLAGPTCTLYVLAGSMLFDAPQAYLAYGAVIATLYVIALRLGARHEDVE